MKIYIGHYIKDIKARNFSPRTIESYSRQLNKFAEFAKNVSPGEITIELVENYRATLQANSPSSINYSLVTIRAFLKYLARKQITSLPSEAIQLSKTEQPETTFLEETEVNQLLKAIPTKTFTGIRDGAVIQTLLATGLRVSELVNLKTNQINFVRKEFTIRGKGRKLRIGFLNDTAISALQAWLKARPDTSEYLFVTNRTTNPHKMSPRAIQRLVNSYKTKARLNKQISPHTLRHTYATKMLRKVNNIKIVSELLGHANVNTTSRYTHVTDEDLKKSYFSS